MIKTGIVIGKFAPLTTGHINLINVAATECQRVIVVVSHHDGWLKSQNPRDRKILTLKNRMRWLNEIYGDIDHVSVDFIDESEIPQYPDGWEPYCALLRDKFGKDDPTIFSSELDYDEKYKELLPNFGHVVVDANRTRVPISATAIRSDLYGNWNYLPSVVRQHYTKKVVVIGMESCGKSTLTKMLAKLYNTSWVEEYGRTFCEVDLHKNESLLTSKDYETITLRQKELETQGLRTANRIMFCDTNAFITQYYHVLYEGYFNSVVDAIAREEQYDLVLFLSPDVPWVDDGLRLNADRSKTAPVFKRVSERYPNQFPEKRVVVIEGTSYKDRMDKAIRAVDSFLNLVEQGEL